jgi:uncharacterized protein (DUF1778 family)
MLMGKIKETNKRVAITMDKEKVWELKEKAAKAEMTLSEFMVASASEVDPTKIVQTKEISGQD